MIEKRTTKINARSRSETTGTRKEEQMDPIYSYGIKFDIPMIILFLFNLNSHVHTRTQSRTITHVYTNANPNTRENCTLFSLSLSLSISICRSAILYSKTRAKFEYNERLIKTTGLGCTVVRKIQNFSNSRVFRCMRFLMYKFYFCITPTVVTKFLAFLC